MTNLSFQNPFITSSEVYAGNDFYNRKSVLRETDKFIKRTKDYNFLIFGQRRIGKTSVLKKIEKLYDKDTSKAIYITLQGEAETGLNDLLNKIAQRIIKKLNFEYKTPLNEKSFISDFLPTLKTVLKKQKLILLFDEFDVLGELENITQFIKTFSFHRFIPYCADIIENLKQNDIPVKIIFAIGRNYKDLDTNRFGQITKFGQQAEIGFFSKEIVMQLLAQTNNTLPFTEKAKLKIFEITGGQPYFTQCIAHIAFDKAQDENLNIINTQTVEESLPIAIKRYSNGVIWIWDTLTPRDKIILYISAHISENGLNINEKNIKAGAENMAVLPACNKLYETLSRLDNIKFLRKGNDRNYKFYVEFFKKWIIAEISPENIQSFFSKIDIEIDNLLTNARFNFTEKNYTEAEKLFAEIVNNRPQHYEALFYLAKSKQLQNNKIAENYQIIFENYNKAHKLNPAYKPDEFLSFLYEYYDFTKKQNTENHKIIQLINKLNPNDKEINKLISSNIIQQLEKKLNTEFVKVDISKVPRIRIGKTAEYSTDKNRDITGLMIIHSDIEDISFFKNFKNLTRLDLKFNKITDITSLKDLKNLTSLDLSDNNISDISFLKDLKSLTKLNLRSNKISDISVLEKLINLQELWLGGNNQITDISFLKDLTRLTNLSLRFNNITDISFLKDLTRLTNLSLRNNNISDISFLKDFTSLTNLNLSVNNISNISFLKDLTRLTNLSLRFNNITDISFLKDLTRLTNLSLSSNNISNISFLKNLTSLTSLDLSLNKISDISFLKDLTRLTSLDLSHNQISDISFLKDLTSLTKLVLSSNIISELHDWITDFDMEILLNEYSSGIRLNGNPIESPPIEIVERGKEAIKNYFEQIEEFDYLFEAKLLLVGEERAGKSTIAKALIEKDFKINLNEQSTHGIEIEKWIIPRKDVKTDKDFRFNIWDFGGQEIYHATHQFFLTKRSLYLFVTEARKDLRFDDFYYWLNIINTLAGNSPVILVQNKADQSHQDTSIEEYKTSFPQIFNGLQKVSCNTEHEQWKSKYSRTLEMLKQTIFDVLRNKKLDGIGDKLPRTWVKVRKEITDLQNQNLNYINLNKYYEICEKHGLDEEKAIFLSDYFHDLGVFLHFRNDVQLRNIIFINHEWVTKGIYNVFDNDKIKNETHGKFYDKDLIEIWSELQFEDKQAELLNLMKNNEFKICYQHKNGYYLAPQLFNDKKIDYDWRSGNDNLIFRYNYTFMPKGILSQLIVMLNRYIYKDTYWKYGVLFEYKKNTRAIVTENRFKNENLIKIRVEGQEKQKLLTIIGSNIEEINQSYTNLKVSEEFACNCDECQNSEKPYYWKLETINRAIKKGKREVECQISFDDIEINKLLGNYIPIEQISVYEQNRTKNITNIFQNTYPADDLQEIKDLLNYVHSDIRDQIYDHLEATIDHIELNSDEIKDELKEKYDNLFKELKKSKNTQAKIKVVIPLLKLLDLTGIPVGTVTEIILKTIDIKFQGEQKIKLKRKFNKAFPPK